MENVHILWFSYFALHFIPITNHKCTGISVCILSAMGNIFHLFPNYPLKKPCNISMIQGTSFTLVLFQNYTIPFNDTKITYSPLDTTQNYMMRKISRYLVSFLILYNMTSFQSSFNISINTWSALL